MANTNTSTVKEEYIEKIIDNASQLPLECQEYVLAIMKGMVFTREVLAKKIREEA